MGLPTQEQKNVEQVWDALNAAGYVIDVRDGAGEDWTSLDKDEAVAEVTSCDEGYFVVYDGDERVGWVWFVFGNLPAEVVSDYTTNLEPVLSPLFREWWN